MNTQNIQQYYGSRLDVVLDSSEYYDYELGDNEIDYVSYELFGLLGQWILTENGNPLITEDNLIINY